MVKHSRRRNGVAGSTTILGQMPDWNPGELIGSKPRPLAASLFRMLITESVWQEARSRMGYRSVPDTALMIVLAGRPYVDVRASFNSFLPAGMPCADEDAVVDAWLERLRRYPEYHDKIEFLVAQTVLDFSFRRDFQQRYEGTLSHHSFLDYAERLRRLTNRNVSRDHSSSLALALREVRKLELRSESRRVCGSAVALLRVSIVAGVSVAGHPPVCRSRAPRVYRGINTPFRSAEVRLEP